MAKPFRYPVISVIIPIYKNEATLERALASLNDLDITLQNSLELILVFDGSEHVSREIAASCLRNTNYSYLLLDQLHSGVSVARNNGVKNATGEFITFLDADDEILGERFHFIPDEQSTKIIIGKQQVVVSEDRYLNKPELLSVVAPSDYHIMSMVLSRKLFYSVGEFDKNFSVGSDWDFIIRAKSAGFTIDYVDRYFLRRHVHLKNTSLGVGTLRKDHIQAIRKHIREE